MTLYHGDCLEVMPSLPAGSARCCVTSPPYFGLRDYGTAEWEGGDPACGHVEMATGMSERNTLGPVGYLPPTNAANVGRVRQYRDTCGKCGATRKDAQIGLEETPEAYVARLVEVFREVRRVLSDDGTCWVNLGDSYAAGGTGGASDKSTLKNDGRRLVGARNHEQQLNASARTRPVPEGLKPKDLIGIPWRVAFALQADGWYLRSDCIWHKPNAMPESVRDRPTKAHEYLFLLAKSERYYYDADAVKEPIAGVRQHTERRDVVREGLPKNMPVARYSTGASGFKTDPTGRNRRTVWNIATKPYSGAHFAVMPEALVEPCVLAGSAAGDTILDPFAGSGTVGAVAVKHGRGFVGIDLNADYLALAERRIAAAQPPLFAEVAD